MSALPAGWSIVEEPSYDTELSPEEEKQFSAWKLAHAFNDSGEDYDYRGAFKAGLTADENGHWPDTYKKPNHPTFSDESIYAKDAPEKAGHWNGDSYMPPENLPDGWQVVEPPKPETTPLTGPDAVSADIALENTPEEQAYARAVATGMRNNAAPIVKMGGAVLAPLALASLATPAAPVGALALGASAILGGAAGQGLGDIIEGRQLTPAEALKRDAFAGLVAGVSMGIPAPRAVLNPVANLIRQGGTGAAVGAGATVAYEQFVEGKINLEDVLAGAAIGGGIGLVRGVWQNGDARQRLIEQARQLGFKGKTQEELAQWVDDERAARAKPVEPAAAAPDSTTPPKGWLLVDEAAPGAGKPAPAPIEPAPVGPGAINRTNRTDGTNISELVEPTPAALPKGWALAAKESDLAANKTTPETPVPPAIVTEPASAGDAVLADSASVAGLGGGQTPANVPKMPIAVNSQKRASLGVGLAPDGNPDLLTDIESLVGPIAMRPPKGSSKGGEYDGVAEAFSRGAARLLRGTTGTPTDQAVAILNESGYQFQSTSEFTEAVSQASANREKLRVSLAKQKYQTGVELAALNNTGRKVALKAPAPLPVEELGVGAEFHIKGERFKIVDEQPTTDDPSGDIYTIQDGHKFEVPAGTPIYPDKGKFKAPAASAPLAPENDPLSDQFARPQVPSVIDAGGQTGIPGYEETFNLAGTEQPDPSRALAAEEARRAQEQAQGNLFTPNTARGAMASPGRMGDRPPPEGPRTPDVGPGMDDPSFTRLPLQLPEMVQFYKTVSGGKVPSIVERIRLLHGQALGVFRFKEGNIDSGKIELRADLFHLLSEPEKRGLLNEAVDWATTMKQANPDLNLQEAISRRFHELVKAAEAKAVQQDPQRALETFAHEIGHFVDFMPEGTIARGNILGRIASLKRHLKSFIGEHPAISAQPPTPNERAKLRRQAERELEKQVREVVETIRREEPVYKTVPVTPEMITSILKQAQREEFPDLYDWFARLDRAGKADVLRKAMKGAVDERAAAMASRQQVGTKVVEETVTRKVGEVTPEAIRARYAELLRAELKRRGLISERDIRRELEGAIAWWNGTDTVPAYYKTSEEMYAETFSILLNNPAALAKRAPTFWRAFFNYLERKPAIKAAYQQLQDDIRSGTIFKQRVENLRAAWREDEDAALLKDIAGTRVDWRKVRDTLRLLFDRQHGPIEARALRRLDTPQAGQVLAAMKDYLYRATAIEAYARDLSLRVEALLSRNNLRHDDLAEFMFHARIAAGDRQELANAQGWSPNTSGQRLQEMQRDIGPERFAALEAAQRENRAIYEKHVVALLERADVLTPELLQAIKERTLYATFAKTREFNPLEASTIEGLLEQRYGKDVTAHIYRQIGYLGDVQSPYLAMTQKAFSLIQFAYRQIALRALRDFMVETEPLLIAEAETRFSGTHWEPRIVDTPRVGTMILVEKGEAKAYYIPREIAEVMERGSPLETMVVGLAHRALTWPKALLTELNPGFWPVAFGKDIATLGLQVPKGVRAWRQLPRAYMAARASLTGKPDTVADAALKRLMVISRADPRGEHLGHPDEMTRMLLRMGQNPQLWDAEAKKISRAMRFWMAWKRQGQVYERTVKIAGMLHLDSEAFATMPEWQKKRIVNELVGSPDFLERGRAASVVELAGGPIFYNAWLQGMRAFKRAAFGGGGTPANPREFWTKFLLWFGLPALAYYAFEKGWTNLCVDRKEAEDTRDQLRSIPERDKLRGFVIPMGWADKSQGKVAYLVLPYPDQVRYLQAGMRKAVQTIGGDNAKNQGLGGLVQFGGQDLPGQNPLIAEGVKWWQYYALGQNPYDAFRARPALDPDVYLAGQGGPELAKQSLSNITGGIVYRNQPQRPGDNKTGLEQFLSTPTIGNLLGRWMRVSNAGLYEDARRITEPIIQHQAALRIVGDEMARKLLVGEPWSKTEDTLSQNEPYLVEYLFGRMGKLMENATAPELRALNQARSTEEKVALLQAWAQREEEKKKRLGGN